MLLKLFCLFSAAILSARVLNRGSSVSAIIPTRCLADAGCVLVAGKDPNWRGEMVDIRLSVVVAEGMCALCLQGLCLSFSNLARHDKMPAKEPMLGAREEADGKAASSFK